MTLELQIYNSNFNIRMALDRIVVLEKAVDKLVAMETTRQLASKALCDLEALRDSVNTFTSHTLYVNGDTNIPSTLLDRNGDVVLDMCKVCGKAESELSENCTKPN